MRRLMLLAASIALLPSALAAQLTMTRIDTIPRAYYATILTMVTADVRATGGENHATEQMFALRAGLRREEGGTSLLIERIERGGEDCCAEVTEAYEIDLYAVASHVGISNVGWPIELLGAVGRDVFRVRMPGGVIRIRIGAGASFSASKEPASPR